MNERIKELATQAGLQPFEDCGPGYVYKMEKFAELIIQECISQCWSVSELEHRGTVISECSKRIRKKFGME